MSDLNILLDGLIEDAWYEGLASDGSKLAKYMAAQNDPQSIRQKIVDEFDALNQRIAELELLETRLREMKLGWTVDHLHDTKPVYKGVNVRYAPEVLSPDELRLWNQRIVDED